MSSLQPENVNFMKTSSKSANSGGSLNSIKFVCKIAQTGYKM